MAVDVEQLVGGALSGALVTSVLAPLIGQRLQRRDLRAVVLRAVGELERTRWADEDGLEAFREAVLAVRAAALVAGADRQVIDHYVFLARVARRSSDRGVHVDEGATGFIDTRLAELVQSAAEVVVDHLWHPHLKCHAVRRGLEKNRMAEKALRDAGEQELWHEGKSIDWNPPAVYG